MQAGLATVTRHHERQRWQIFRGQLRNSSTRNEISSTIVADGASIYQNLSATLLKILAKADRGATYSIGKAFLLGKG
jgi:hypothetical protein